MASNTQEPETGALGAALQGLRGELARAGVLRGGTGYPRVMVELVRVDERATLVALERDETGGLLSPQGQGSLVGVTARAWVLPAPGAPPRSDTGDVRRTAGFAFHPEPGRDTVVRESALQSAGRATGRALGRRILGEIEPGREPF